MKKHLSKKRVVLAAIVVVVLAVASGVAYAYWTSTGSGTATAGVDGGTPASITVTQDSTLSGLYPGGPAQAIRFTIANAAEYAQNVKTVDVAFDSPAITDGGVGCTTADFALAATPVALDDPLGVTIDANGSVAFTAADVTLPTIKMNETHQNQNDCKTATVHLKFTAS